jgi:hypothetical protein
MTLNLYMVIGTSYALVLCLYDGIWKQIHQSIFDILGTLTSAALWPLTIPVDVIILVYQKNKGR